MWSLTLFLILLVSCYETHKTTAMQRYRSCNKVFVSMHWWLITILSFRMTFPLQRYHKFWTPCEMTHLNFNLVHCNLLLVGFFWHKKSRHLFWQANPNLYDIRLRPYFGTDKPVNVSIGIELSNIEDISEVTMDYKLSCLFTIRNVVDKFYKMYN